MAKDEKGLEAAFRKAQASGNLAATKAAKAEFAAARTKRKQQEAFDPSHPRQHRIHNVGISSGSVTYDDGTTVTSGG